MDREVALNRDEGLSITYQFVSHSKGVSRKDLFLSYRDTTRKTPDTVSPETVSGRVAMRQGMVTLTPGTAKVTAGGP
jgi:hypothetical protein